MPSLWLRKAHPIPQSRMGIEVKNLESMDK